jgi:general secretion pathway protein K
MTAAPAHRPLPHASSGGFIVVAVLWILGALASLVSIYAIYVIETAAASGLHEDRFRAEALASAAVELAAYRLSGPAQTRLSNGQFAFRLAGATVGAEFRSEAARIDLNAASKELLAGLLQMLGERREAAEAYADRIIAWRSTEIKPQDWDASPYRLAGLPYAPRGGKYPHVNEVALVLGLPPSLLERALPFLTVYSGRAQIDIRAAAPEVIAALPGMTRERVEAVLQQRRSPTIDGQTLLALLGPAQGFATLDPGRTARVTMQIALENGRRIGCEVVILMFDDGDEPYSVLFWHEDMDDAGHDSAQRRASR